MIAEVNCSNLRVTFVIQGKVLAHRTAVLPLDVDFRHLKDERKAGTWPPNAHHRALKRLHNPSTPKERNISTAKICGDHATRGGLLGTQVSLIRDGFTFAADN
ncbi:hypothetical protein PM082_017926 [Marasmius tenuissimus]|nr:hypothetical protein PM082_017926 [Marasmius tenuissimus]